eukprot:TRINITY_DN5177_c0_g1_i1.p1 TRINITY_DN5177_c0_g1~~TRINITY_DN5177_c0_g1_i1.p1  ORF type:complete len:299 (-),score=98.68 TRINITY_DN5177_c0_g1_i1:58-954(-)
MGTSQSTEKHASPPRSPTSTIPQTASPVGIPSRPIRANRDNSSTSSSNSAVNSVVDINIMMSPQGSPMSLPSSSLGRGRGGGDDTTSPPSSRLVPTVFTWSGGGKDVYITGAFNGWKEKIPLNLSEKDFTAIQYLPPGVYQYKFIVDGKWVHAADQPIQTDMKGNINNFLEVRTTNPLDDLSSPFITPQGSPVESYGCTIPGPDFQKTNPQALPPHLERALLNTARISHDPSHLPLPHHVMLNHFYSMEKEDDDVMILGVTHRFKAKFVTTVLYKPASAGGSIDHDDTSNFVVNDIEL